MRVCLSIHHYLDRNAGAAGAVLDLADALVMQGAKVEILSFDRLPKWLPQLLKGVLYPFWVAKWLALNSKRFDIVDASSGDGWVYGCIAGPKCPPLITHSHGLEHAVHARLIDEAKRHRRRLSWKYPFYHGGYRLWEVRLSMIKADLCLFLNQDDRELAAKELGISFDKSEVLPNGCSRDLLQNPSVVASSDHVKFVQIGSYIKRKGVEYTAQAMSDVLTEYPCVELLFLGTGVEKNVVYRDYPERVHGQIEVIQRFERENLYTIIEGCNVILFPSLSEGFGLTLLEGMACGLAPISTSIPGPSSIVTPDVHGLVVPPADAAALKGAAKQLIEDKLLRENLAKSAKERAKDFDWDLLARKRLSLYGRVIHQRNK